MLDTLLVDSISNESKSQAYQAWLGFYKGSLRNLRWSEDDLITHANSYALDALKYQADDREPVHGANSHLPPLFATTIGKMGLKAQRNKLNVAPDSAKQSLKGGRGGRPAAQQSRPQPTGSQQSIPGSQVRQPRVNGDESFGGGPTRGNSSRGRGAGRGRGRGRGRGQA